jgi:hypothetical protein
VVILWPKSPNRSYWFWKPEATGFDAKLRETVPVVLMSNYSQIVALVLRSTKKPEATSFEVKLRETIATGFEAKPGETITTGFEAKLGQTVPVGLRPKH